jgi:hypothetical protein
MVEIAKQDALISKSSHAPSMRVRLSLIVFAGKNILRHPKRIPLISVTIPQTFSTVIIM